MPELDAALDAVFSFDNFREQEENHIAVTEPFRADGLQRVLYQCPHCGREGHMEGKGTTLTCHACGKTYELTPTGYLKAQEGDTEFPHIPDWYAWERENVRKSLLDGSYLLDIPVKIAMMVDYKAIYRVGEGRLRHDANGFRLTGCDGETGLFPSLRWLPMAFTPTTSGTNWGTSSASAIRTSSITASPRAAMWWPKPAWLQRSCTS